MNIRWSTILRDRVYMVLLCVTATLSFTLLQMPLIRDGDYEFAEALTLWLLPISGIVVARSRFRQWTTPELAISVQIIALVGLFALLVNGCGCSLSRSLFFYTLLPFLAAQIGGISGWIAAGSTRIRAFWILITFWIGSLIWQAVWVVWFVPISVYSIVWGFFAGPVYDEWVPMHDRLLAYRILSILAAFWILSVWSVFRHDASKPKLTIAGLAGLGLMAGFYWPGGIGTDSYGNLHKVLPQTFTSGMITAHSSIDADSSKSIRLARLADFYYSGMVEKLAVGNPPSVGIYVYADEVEKKALFGAGPTNFAKIWNHEIHVNTEDAESVIKHELVHVLSTAFGNRWYGTTKVGLLEGLAVAVDWPGDNHTPHEWSAMLLKRGKLPDVAGLLDGTTFFGGSSSIGYNVAGSFVRHLMDTFDVEKIKFLFGGRSFESVFGVDIHQAADRWQAFLRTIPIDDNQLRMADLMLSRGVLQKKCVHAVADKVMAAQDHVTLQEYATAAKLLEDALAMSPEEPSLKLRKWRMDFLAGIPVQIDSHDLAGFPFHIQMAIHLLMVDQAIVNDERAWAVTNLDQIKRSNPGYLRLDRAIAYRRFVCAFATKGESDSLLRLGVGIDKIKLKRNEAREVRVWSAAAALASGEAAYAYDLLSDLTPLGDSTVDQLRLECLALAAYEEGQTAEAVRAVKELTRALRSEASAQQWIERMAFWEWLDTQH